MHKILADECIHKDLVEALREEGNSVEWVTEMELSGSSDDVVFEHALKNNLILLTFDRGFGDIFNYNINNCPGIIIELIHGMEKSEIIEFAKFALSQYEDFSGKLIIIGKNKIRLIDRRKDY